MTDAERILVTGASGFVGSALTQRLVAQGRQVHATDLRAGAVPTVGLDVTDAAAVLALFERVRPGVVVHSAAMVDDRGARETFQRVNVGGTQNVLSAAAITGVQRVVHISSIAALGFDPGPDADEQTPLDLTTGSPYFDTKAASEKLVHDAHAAGRVPAVIVRPGDVWGPASVQWVHRPVEMMRRRMPVLIGGGVGRIAHCWIDNLIDGIILAIDTPGASGGTFAFHDGSTDTEFRRYLECLADAARVRRPTRSLPPSVALAIAAAGEVAHRVAGIEPMMTRGAVHYVSRRATYSLKASEEVLGYRPSVDLNSGMMQLAAVFKR